MSVISLKCSAKSPGTPYGFSMPGIDLGVFAIGSRQLLLDLTNRGEVLVELPLIGRSEAPAQPAVSSVTKSSRLRRSTWRRARASGAELGAVAEQPLEQRARIEHRRQRLRLVPPRQIVGVGARIAGVAVAGLAGVLEPHFERREARLAADLIRHQLVARHAGPDVADGLLDLDAGEVRTAAAPVVAGAVEQGPAGVVREIPEQQDVLLQRRRAAPASAADSASAPSYAGFQWRMSIPLGT